ncbi:MAG: hypothetical protein AAF502_16840 [Bacteroidota bacterium]
MERLKGAYFFDLELFFTDQQEKTEALNFLSSKLDVLVKTYDYIPFSNKNGVTVGWKRPDLKDYFVTLYAPDRTDKFSITIGIQKTVQK